MSLAQENRLRELCRRAARETDVNKLLVLFLELDRTAEQEQQPMFLARPLEHTGWLASEEHPQAQ
ncbi:MAG TPA: hypothetical protein VMH03_14085 [Terriglobales bacterium]|nr:hypothetical protein [Terriglobales bacterium]